MKKVMLYINDVHLRVIKPGSRMVLPACLKNLMSSWW